MKPRPVTYRAEIIGPALTGIAAGECCSIVGTSGVGKSNLVQHMLRADVLQHHLSDQADQFRFVIFDTNLLAEWSEWGFFEGLSEALLALSGPQIPSDTIDQLRQAHQQVLATTGHYATALRQCADLLAFLCAQWRIVVLFDEFDRLFMQLSSGVLRNLRGLRDRHKYRLMYLTFSRQPLASLRDDADWEEIEAFVELLSLRELGLRPLCDADAALEVERFAERHQRTLELVTRDLIVALSGGHPAILRALTHEALAQQAPLIEQRERLHQLPTIRLECAKIWQQLSGNEQDVLLDVLRGERPDQLSGSTLMLKGLVRQAPNGTYSLFSAIVAAYLSDIEAAPDDAPPPLHIDIDRKLVHYYGCDISDKLTPLQYHLLVYLWQRWGQICSVADVAQALHPNEPRVYFDDNSEYERVRVLARRLRQRLLTLAPDQPVPLNIFHGLGYRLGGALAEREDANSADAR